MNVQKRKNNPTWKEKSNNNCSAKETQKSHAINSRIELKIIRQEMEEKGRERMLARHFDF
jgi:hypothetical protein